MLNSTTETMIKQSIFHWWWFKTFVYDWRSETYWRMAEYTFSNVVCVFLQRFVNPHARTLELPFCNRLQSAQIPSNFYTLDEVSFVAVY